jgi:hypothetical protein
MNHDEAVRWIRRYEVGDATYPYRAWQWYVSEARIRRLTADEEKTLWWIKEEYGIEARLQKLPLQPRDWRKGKV